MKFRSIRTKIALSAGVLASLMVVLFAGLSATWYYYEERSEAVDASPHPLEPDTTAEQLVDARTGAEELMGIYLVVLPVLTAIVGAAAWWMAGRLALPLRQLADAATAIDVTTLHARLPDPATHDEIARLANVLNAAFARLETSFAQADRFAADASHELRTPLAVMRGRIELAINENPSAPHAALLVQLLEDNQRLAAITEKLLLLARADAGKLATAARPVDFSALVESLLEDFALLDADRSLQLDHDVAPDVFVRGDDSLLRQMLLNLFENAVKYTPAGGNVRVRLDRRAGRAVFIIGNTGSGIAPELQPHLFERFFRASESRARESGGAGLGLSLGREIAAAHRGTLELLSSDRRETVFEVSLPARPSPAPIAKSVATLASAS